jgi:DNA topoisomerase-3
MLYIAEKPELARAIVEGLGGGTKRNGFYECSDDRVTWCFGHMLQLYEPEDYDPSYKKWTLESLPMFFVPWKKRPVPKSKDQFAIIVGLLRETDAVCHAGDPDAEGQLLIDELLEYVGYTGRVLRVLINDNNIEVVKKALANLRDNAEFKGLSAAAEARQVGDQIFGFNMTRLYTLAARREGYTGVLSVGRVQTPILGLVVRRDRENAGHQKVPYFMVHGVFRSGDSRFIASYQVKPADTQDDKGRLNHPADANAIADSIGGKTAVVASSETKPGETPPPLPYNLLKLQSDASRLFGIGPDKVKTITQNLREKHRLITYNRSDSQYLSSEQHADGPTVIAAIVDMVPEFKAHEAKLDAARKSRAFDSSKVTAHHAIIPTRAIAASDKLSQDERRIYTLLARAYLAQFMPPHKWERTVTAFEIEGHTFIRTAKATLENGWRDLYAADPKPETDDPDGEDDDVSVSPAFTVGQEIACLSGESVRKETAPKPLYTMSSLLEDLTRVAQYITDEKLRKTLVEKDKDKPGERGGIGTPATRDEILKTLFDRGLVEYRKKGKKQHVVSTKTGQDFYDCLPDTVKFPDMTALWHDQQLEIEKGERDIDSFIDGILSHIGEEIARVLDNGLSLNIEKHPCPTCGNAMMLKKAGDKPFWGCSNYPRCRTTLPDDNGKPGSKPVLATVDPSVVCPLCGKPMRLREHPKGSFFGCSDFPSCKGSIKAKDGKPVSGQPRPTASEKHMCKTCGRGLVRRSRQKDGSFFWGCGSFPECKTSYPDIDGKPNYTATDKKEKCK